MQELDINHWAVLVAAISDFVVGALWYSPLLFNKAWMAENGFTADDMKRVNPAKTYGLTLVFALIITYNLAAFTGGQSFDFVLFASIAAGLGWAAMSFATVGLFELKSWRYILINCGYIVLAYSLKGVILGLWP